MHYTLSVYIPQFGSALGVLTSSVQRNCDRVLNVPRLRQSPQAPLAIPRGARRWRGIWAISALRSRRAVVAAREPILDSLRRGPVSRFLGPVPRFLGPVPRPDSSVPRPGSSVPWPGSSISRPGSSI